MARNVSVPKNKKKINWQLQLSTFEYEFCDGLIFLMGHFIICRKLQLKKHTTHNTHWFHDSNVFFSNQCSLLLIGQILVTADPLDLILKLLLSPCHIMVSLHEWSMPQFFPKQSDSSKFHNKSLKFRDQLRIVCSDGFNNSLVASS